MHQVGACIRRNPGARSRARVLQMLRSVLAPRHLKAVPCDYPVTMFAAGWVVLDKTLALNHPATASPSLRSTLRRRGQFFWVCWVLMWPGVSVLTPIGARLCSLEVQSKDQKRCSADTLCVQVGAAPCSRGVRHSAARFVLLVSSKTMPCDNSVRPGRRGSVVAPHALRR